MYSQCPKLESKQVLSLHFYLKDLLRLQGFQKPYKSITGHWSIWSMPGGGLFICIEANWFALYTERWCDLWKVNADPLWFLKPILWEFALKRQLHAIDMAPQLRVSRECLFNHSSNAESDLQMELLLVSDWQASVVTTKLKIMLILLSNGISIQWHNFSCS